MPGFYRDVLGPALTEAIENLSGGAVSEQLQLFEELAITRHAAKDAVRLYAKACQVEGEKGIELRATASQLMQTQLSQVARLCESAARVESLQSDKFSVHTVQLLIQQIVRISAQVFGEHPSLAEVFAKRLKSEVKIPTVQALGTSLTPDADALAMDETVPVFTEGVVA